MAVITNETLNQVSTVGEAYVHLGIDKLGIVNLFGDEAGIVACASGHKPVVKLLFTHDTGSNQIPLYVCPHVISPTSGAKTQVVEKPVYIENDASTFIPFGSGLFLGVLIAMIGAYLFAKKNKGRLDEAFEESERLLDRKIKEAQERLEQAKNIKNKGKK